MDFMVRPVTTWLLCHDIVAVVSQCWGWLRYGRISWSFHLHWRASGGLYGSLWIPLQQWDAMGQPLNHHLNHLAASRLTMTHEIQAPISIYFQHNSNKLHESLNHIEPPKLCWIFEKPDRSMQVKPCAILKNFTMHHPTILTLPYGQMPEPCHVVETDGGSHLEGLRHRVAISVLR